MQDVWLQLVLILALVVLNAILAGSEIALVSLREGQLQRLQEGNRREQTLASLARDPNRFLSTIQIGITLAGFLASATAAVTLARPLIEPLSFLGSYARPAAIVLVTIILSYLTLVLGELAPKRVALQRAEGWGTLFARPLNAFAHIATPMLWLLERSTDAVVRLMGGDPSKSREEMSEEELRDTLLTRPGFSRLQREILSGAFEITDRRLRQVAVPRPDVTFLSAELPAPQAVEKLLEIGHSRAPVHGEDLDDVIGIVHLRDLIRAEGPIGDCARDALALPETLTVIESLRRMQRERQLMAIVIDEHGGVEGVVTIEDLLEELVGEIYDEFDRDTSGIERKADGAFELPGGFPLHDLGDIDIDLGAPGDFTTIAGLVLDRLGRLPKPDERLEVEGWEIEVMEVSDRAIERVRLRPIKGQR
ncbi:MAG: hemolysin family protein [Actinomycetota bacterium]